MYKIKDNVQLEELEQFDFKYVNYGGVTYEKSYRKITYGITAKRRFIIRLRDMGEFFDEEKTTMQDIKRLGITDLVEKVGE